jgi:Glycosyltransferase family 87
MRLQLALFAATALTCATAAMFAIQPNDEGLMLQAAARIADGHAPYDDFWWFYPPGQPVLLGALWAALGPSLLTWKVVRALAAGAAALLAWRLARRGGAPAWAAALAWLAATFALAYPSGPHPFPITLALCLGALLCLHRPPLAGALTGVAAFWRLEFAAYLVLGALLAYGVRQERSRAALQYTGVAVGVAAALFAPFVVIAGPGDAFELLIRYPLLDFADYQSLPFPLDYDGPLNTGSLGGFLSDSAESMLLFYLPLALVTGLAGALTATALRFRRDDWWRVAVAIFSLGMLHYLLARADAFHTAPLAMMLGVLAAWSARELVGFPRRPTAAAGAAALALAGLGYAVVEGADRLWLVLRGGGVPLSLPVADGVRVPAEDARALEDAVRAIHARVPPGEPIYVAPRRSDLVTAGNPLLYVLADRPNPTRYDIQAPGVVTSEPVQREIVADLERTRPRVVVRDTSMVTSAAEPNAAGRSSSVTLLDDYLARSYREVERHGALLVLERR